MNNFYIIELVSMINDQAKAPEYYLGYKNFFKTHEHNPYARGTDINEAPKWTSREAAINVAKTLLGTLSCAWVVFEYYYNPALEEFVKKDLTFSEAHAQVMERMNY